MKFLAILGFPVLVAASSIWRGYVLSVLWAWFMVPAFGLPALSVALAIGLSLIVGLVTHQRTGREIEKPFSLGVTVALATLAPALCLLAGWIAHQFV
jgi:hypothetical protein